MDRELRIGTIAGTRHLSRRGAQTYPHYSAALPDTVPNRKGGYSPDNGLEVRVVSRRRARSRKSRQRKRWLVLQNLVAAAKIVVPHGNA